MIRVLIIEDEEPARKLVRTFLEGFSQIEIIAECSDGFAGVKAINELKPDLIFLDIQMPKLTGFELLELIEHKPLVIFTTAYDQYAIRAFEANAADYLLKPFTRERFSDAVEKALIKISQTPPQVVKTEGIIQAHDEKEELLQRVAVKSGSKIHVVSVDHVSHIEAEGDYVMLHTKEGKYLKEKTMKYFESHLDPKQFSRIHRSCIVNVNEILRIDHYDKESYSVVLKNGAQLRASINGYKQLKSLLNL
jgi:two-component system, LytTR family, response regulator